MVSNPSNRIKTEAINEVILRLLGLNPGTELDYQTYHDILKKKLAIARLAGKELAREEDELLRNEFKRVRTIKDRGIRFKVKKVKTKTTAPQGNATQKTLPSTGAIVKAKGANLVSSAVINVNVKDITKETKSEGGDFVGIRKTLESILKTLSSKFKFDQKQADTDRKEKETERRGKKESSLEGFKKGVAGIVAATKKMLSPIQNVIDRIQRFIFFTLLGRAFTAFMDWMKDKENQEKFNAFIEFLTDHWPALAGLYILFGTSFGKLVRGLLKGATRMIIALAMNIGKIRKFIGKHKKLAFLGLAIAPLATRELGNIFGENKETPESGLIPSKSAELGEAQKSIDQTKQSPVPKIPTANVGGMIPKLNLGGLIPSFFGGGMDYYGGIPISGAGKDDTLIAARTGEAVLTEQDQQDIGQRYIERTTGEPLNIPQYLAGRKPSLISMGNIRPRFGGGFNLGGMIPKFNTGGIVGNKSLSGSVDFGDLPLIKSANSAGIRGMELAAFLSQMSHETGGYRWKKELGGGKGRGYSGGSKYHGRGYIQLTHDYNYQKYGNKLGLDLIKNPDLAADKDVAAKIAVMYWKDNVRPAVGNNWNDVFAVSRAINNPSASSPKGINGWDDRVSKFERYKKKLKSGSLNINSNKPKPKKKTTNFWSNFATFMPSSLPFMGGGYIKENSGSNIPGASADRQLIAAQPGEYMLPAETVLRLGGPTIIDRLVAMTDSNSTPFKQGVLSRPQITPYGSGNVNSGMMSLPPMMLSADGSLRPRAAGLGGGSEVPSFSAISPHNERAKNASIYGLVG